MSREAMLSRISQYIKKTVLSVINISGIGIRNIFRPVASVSSRFTAHILYPYLDNLATIAVNHPQGVGIARIGIWPFRRHIVLIMPKQPPAEAARMLSQVMNLNEAGARRIYRYFSFLTRVSPFLGMNDDKAVATRKKWIVPYLVPKNSYEDAQSGTRRLLRTLNNLKNIQPRIENIDGTEVRIRPGMFKFVIHHVFDSFLQTLLDAEMDEEMKEEILAIEQSSLAFIFGFAPEFILDLLRHVPAIRSDLQKYDQMIRRFLRMNIEKASHGQSGKPGRRNWWLDMISAKLPGKDPKKLSREEMDFLCDDEDIRLSVSVVLGVRNVSNVVFAMLNYLFIESNEHARLFLAELVKEINSRLDAHGVIPQKDIMSKDSMPLLHACYLEVLRHTGSRQYIPRYTESGFMLECGVSIPSSSMVMFLLDTPLRMFGSAQYPANIFAPQRFLSASGQLTDEARDAVSLFHSFGIGPRICPGSHISEVYCKAYLAGFVRHIKFISVNNIVELQHADWLDAGVLNNPVVIQNGQDSVPVTPVPESRQDAGDSVKLSQAGFFSGNDAATLGVSHGISEHQDQAGISCAREIKIS